jgi:tripartite-type tricarboxylate transporter receptor subunit TctC
VDRLNAEIIKALDTETVRDRLRKIGGAPTPITAQAFAEQFKREIEINAALVKAVGLQPN